MPNQTRRGKTSAGVLLFRRSPVGVEVLLAHPGGPYWANKDDHAWSIPKGEFDATREQALQAALREFTEETGAAVTVPLVALAPVKQKGGKVVYAFAGEQDFAPATLRSNTFSLEWPPRSGQMRAYPEIDRVAWLVLDQARIKLLPAQIPFLDELEQRTTGTAAGATRP